MSQKIINENLLKDKLAKINAPKPSKMAKEKAIEIAMQNFDLLEEEKKNTLKNEQNQIDKEKIQKNEKKFQGNMKTDRLNVIDAKKSSIKQSLTIWRRIMNNQFKLKPVTGMVAACALLILVGGPLILNSYKASISDMTGVEQNIASTEIQPESLQLAETEIAISNKSAPKTEQVIAKKDIANKKGTVLNELTFDAKSDMVKASPTPTIAPQRNMVAKRKMLSSMALEGRASSYGIATSSAVPIIQNDIIIDNSYKAVGRDKFEDFKDNPVKLVKEQPVSTFSIDVDTASYAFVRRMLNSGVLPQKDAVRVEEFINYFDYDYPVSNNKEEPFKPIIAVYDSPWQAGNKLIHIGIKGYDIDKSEKPRSNLVFLIDTSGSMNSPDKLPLLINSMKMLVDSLDENDTVGIVTYAGSAGIVLEPTKVKDKNKIIPALERLRSGGSTAGAAGIRTAYNLIEQNFDKNAVNRVILATDGDFNVGITNQQELQDFIERKRKTGVFLSVLGFGQGNYHDSLMQKLAQNGNGNAAYIDSLNEARKVLVDEASGTLFTIAKDVKIQVEFNPKKVAEYRLIGYETRKLNREDFNNDKVDAGEIGSGHTITAIYEITPVGAENKLIDDLRYGADKNEIESVTENKDEEYAFLKIRYKLPNAEKSKLITRPITVKDEVSFENASDDIRFAAAVAAFAQKLRGGKYIGEFSYDDIINIAKNAKGEDEFGYRAEFINLVRLAKTASAMQK